MKTTVANNSNSTKTTRARRKETGWDDVASAPESVVKALPIALPAVAPPAVAQSPAPTSPDLCVSMDFPLGATLPEITDPFTGEVIPTEDIDAVIGLYEKLERIDKKVYAVKCEIRRAMAAKVEGLGEGKTKRVIGQLRAAKLEFPGDKWSQPVLKKLWSECPQWATTYLRISEIAPNMREVNKLESASGSADFEAFRDELLNANLGPGDALPTLKIEK